MIRYTDISIKKFIQDAKKYKVLTPEQEAKATPEQLVKHNMLFVVKIAKDFTNNNADIADLVSEGMFGLIIASRSYDNSKGFKFITYAVFMIRAYIIKYIRSQKNLIRLPHNQILINAKIQKIIDTHTEEEIKNELGISDVFLKYFYQKPTVESMDAQYNADSDEYTKQYASDEDTFKNFDKQYSKDIVKKLLRNLSDIEYKIIKSVYFEMYPKSFVQIGKEIGMSHQGAKNIYDKALKKLKLQSDVLDL